jgi:hypothetical protein
VGVSSFDAVIESLPRTLPCIIELKSAAATEPMRRAIARHGIGRRVIVAGFDAAATRPLRGEKWALGACTPDVVALLPRALIGFRNRPDHFQALCRAGDVIGAEGLNSHACIDWRGVRYRRQFSRGALSCIRRAVHSGAARAVEP